ncbi:MAG: redox-regulated ATPase YchF [Pirellulales bacterium]|nr:redox-regulated ATPase YchF [Pirellulales bacterium]
MKIGIVGYQGSGKSTLFEWLTGVKADPALAHTSQSAMAPIPDLRIDPLCKIYTPKKITQAALEIVDTPGLSRTHEGNAARLAVLREAGCLLLTVAGFGGADPLVDLRTFEEDLLLADLEIVAGRVQRLEESLKKPRPKDQREAEEAEIVALKLLQATLEAGQQAREASLSDEQRKFTRAFRLLTEKPKMVLVNLADDDPADKYPAPADAAGGGKLAWAAAPLRLELDLAGMSPDDRHAFEQEFGLERVDRDHVIRQIMDASGQMLYFTAGEKEVRTWLLHQGGTALEAAENIHTDLARGFIRAETMRCEDLIRLGSEREIKAHNLLRQEPKDYVVQDGDILHIKFSV